MLFKPQRHALVLADTLVVGEQRKMISLYGILDTKKKKVDGEEKGVDRLISTEPAYLSYDQSIPSMRIHCSVYVGAKTALAG